MFSVHGYHLAFDDTTGFPAKTVLSAEFQKPKQYWKTAENKTKSPLIFSTDGGKDGRWWLCLTMYYGVCYDGAASCTL